MDNVALKIVDEKLSDMTFESGNNGFIVDNDSKAEWCLMKLKQEQREAARIISTCTEMIKHYQQEIKKAEEMLRSNSSYFEMQLEQYFETVDRKETKTQEVYKLPSGTLKRKYPAPQFKRDDGRIVKWLKDRELLGLIKTRETADWANLKKIAQVAGDKVVDENGEVIDGVEVVDRPSEFIVEV